MLRKLNDKIQENLSRTGIIDARAQYRAAARRLSNTIYTAGLGIGQIKFSWRINKC